ncbi:phosphomethylpyrimidine synthase ThiC [Methylicorpusculum oleiharenae]|uniref:phosphomethylpyrimidine synthase ThiC n=1 Tax=Methylicorpusculum oleiharenae TaxID=1338687 RepID=UPI001358F913|nr:phosphomethylpyrimidine synthase ThiC [Methylicorpusculum oleiharenae]MCD2453821.1 phosphomethylpyrimidine synthase ThiC [Methylicorpusculum oleiharenae]
MIIKVQSASGCFEVGLGLKTRVMALVGISHPRQLPDQIAKIRALTTMDNAPDIIGDLSICPIMQDLPLWKWIVKETPFVAACLPVYTISSHGGRIDPAELLDKCIEQMEGGVGILTIHPTPSEDIQSLALNRLVPCTSRGGGIIIADAESRNWRSENAYIEILPQLIHHAKINGTVLSLGASYRSANIFDSCDAAQQAEIERQIELAKIISNEDVGVIIESPGHARPADIKRLASILRKSGFPIMPLGPIPTDTAIGMDHVSSAIGATLLGLEGCAHILAAVTREEHTGRVPSLESTIEAVMSARIAAHVIDLHILGDDAADYAIASARADNRTCIIGKETPGCDRCKHACPL